MTCPICGGKTLVVDSRPDIDNIRRVRKCQECGHRFPTVEIDEDLYNKLKEGQKHHADNQQNHSPLW